MSWHQETPEESAAMAAMLFAAMVAGAIVMCAVTAAAVKLVEWIIG